MGSFTTSHAMATTLRGFEEGSSFGPSFRKHSAASGEDNPDRCGESNTCAAETLDVSPSLVRGTTVDEVDARSMSSNRRSRLKLLELLAGYDVDSSGASPGGVPKAFLLPC